MACRRREDQESVEAFYRGFRDTMTEADHARNRDGAIIQAIEAVQRARGSHHRAGDATVICQLLADADRALLDAKEVAGGGKAWRTGRG